MTSPIDTRISLPLPGPHSSGRTAPASISGPAFSETLRSAVQEVSRLQDDATAAMEQLHAGQTDDVTRVLTAVQKSELAFKTLLAIRAKLMAAYDEIRNMPV